MHFVFVKKWKVLFAPQLRCKENLTRVLELVLALRVLKHRNLVLKQCPCERFGSVLEADLYVAERHRGGWAHRLGASTSAWKTTNRPKQSIESPNDDATL